MALKFRFRWIPFVAALLAAAIGLTAGQWQTRRALEKETIEQRMSERERQMPLILEAGAVPDPEFLEFRQLVLHGEFVPEWNVFLENRPHGGVGGFYVVAPFRLSGGGTVLVMRGWAPRDPADRLRLPGVPLPAGRITLQGQGRTQVGRLMQLGTPDPLKPGAVVQNAGLAEFQQAGFSDLLPVVVEQTSDTGDGLVRDWPRPSTGADKHRGYAFQWYGLALTALLFFFVTGLTRESRS